MTILPSSLEPSFFQSYWRYILVYLMVAGSFIAFWYYDSSPWTSAEYYYIEQFTTCVFSDPSTEIETTFKDVTIYHANSLSLLINTADMSISYHDSEVDCT
ncbi:hypothetical protein HWV01_18145 [Moritella sp. 5]|uniref:hypothetical protein n=1 Tax=Moritella sp. 5 TaxID=2746231 RepID=UPI001BA64DB3|nr:hypothetical protein [Moritella sp. 5]QUM82062.1 hypothetical protein HWV01_18145 [Moritella sp. 5]